VLSGQRYVEFTYEDRPDTSFTFRSGVRYNLTKRVKSIDMYAPNPASAQLVWKYNFAYQLSHSRHSLLTSVAKCGASGGCTRAKIFGWYDPSAVPSFTAKSISAQTLNTTGPREPRTQVADLDGDGADDIVYTPGGTSDVNSPAYARLGSRDSVGTVSPLADLRKLTGNGDFPANAVLRDSRPMDRNADGKAECMARYAESSGLMDRILNWDAANHKFVFAGSVPHPTQTEFGDMNGDGRISSTFATCSTGPRLSDVDGDGRAELIGPVKTSTGSCSSDTYLMRLGDANTQTSTTPATNLVGGVRYYRALPSVAGSWKYSMGDFNGDGLEDILAMPGDPSEVGVILWGTGAGLVLGTGVDIPRSGYGDLRIADVTGDGRLDVVRIVNGQLCVLQQKARYADRLATVTDEGSIGRGSR